MENATKYEIEIYDKIIDASCSKRRPDIVINAISHYIILEIDEFQHKRSGYTPECEQRKMLEFFQSLGGIPVIFLRYNPDNYKPIKDQKMMNIGDREKLLLKYLDVCYNSIPKLVPQDNSRIIHLFYDGFDQSKQYRLEHLNLDFAFKNKGSIEQKQNQIKKETIDPNSSEQVILQSIATHATSEKQVFTEEDILALLCD